MKKQTALRFKVTRRQHASEAAEDYTELISELIAKNGQARTGELALALGVTHVTVVRTIRRLVRDGYLQATPHQPIRLTRKGGRLAEHCKKRHAVVLQFLLQMGVPKEVAEVDAEGIEHHISAITLEKLEEIVQRE